jgi:CDP-diacylglycerol--glycerol-3-phosphate 3-phosphatidyltransferase
MNLPNLLTLLRIFFVPLLVAAMVQERFDFFIAGHAVSREMLALAIFLAAAVTDFVDGHLARRWGQITTVGTLLDPIADKLLISAALVGLVELGEVAAWMVVIIIGREFAVTGLRSIAAAEGFTIKASELGKTKMVAQVVAISLVFLSIRWPSLTLLADIWMWGVVIFAVISAVDYFRKFWGRIDGSIKNRRRKELLALERQERQERVRRRREAH